MSHSSDTEIFSVSIVALMVIDFSINIWMICGIRSKKHEPLSEYIPLYGTVTTSIPLKDSKNNQSKDQESHQANSNSIIRNQLGDQSSIKMTETTTMGSLSISDDGIIPRNQMGDHTSMFTSSFPMKIRKKFGFWKSLVYQLPIGIINIFGNQLWYMYIIIFWVEIQNYNPSITSVYVSYIVRGIQGFIRIFICLIRL